MGTAGPQKGDHGDAAERISRRNDSRRHQAPADDRGAKKGRSTRAAGDGWLLLRPALSFLACDYQRRINLLEVVRVPLASGAQVRTFALTNQLNVDHQRT